MLSQGQVINKDELFNETATFKMDNRLDKWHGVTWGGQEYFYDVETGVVTLIDGLDELMKEYELETGKKAVWRGLLTRKFSEWRKTYNHKGINK